MEFSFETRYDRDVMTVMAHVLRLTLRRKANLRSRILGVIVMLLGIAMIVKADLEDMFFSMGTLVTAAAVILIAAVLIWEDRMNGIIAEKRMMKGTEKAVSVFHEEYYTSTTAIGETKWYYDKIQRLAETEDYFMFIFSVSHAQLYDKKSIKGGTAEEFKKFISGKTGMEFIWVK